MVMDLNKTPHELLKDIILKTRRNNLMWVEKEKDTLTAVVPGELVLPGLKIVRKPSPSLDTYVLMKANTISLFEHAAYDPVEFSDNEQYADKGRFRRFCEPFFSVDTPYLR